MIHIYKVAPDQINRLIFHQDMPKLDPDNEEILRNACNLSLDLYAAFWDDRLLALFGFAAPTILSDSAHLWVHHTPEVDNHKLGFARHSKQFIANMLNVYPKIVGYCATVNARIWLSWLGADFGQPINGIFPFSIERAQ